MKMFLKSFYITLLLEFLILFGAFAAAKSYENIRKTAYGEYRKAVYFEDGNLYFFDTSFELKLPDFMT